MYATSNKEVTDQKVVQRQMGYSQFVHDILFIIYPVATLVLAFIKWLLIREPDSQLLVSLRMSFYRSLFWLYDLVGVGTNNAEAMSVLRNPGQQGTGGLLSVQLLFVVITLCSTIILVILVRSVGTKIAHAVLRPTVATGGLAVFAILSALFSNVNLVPDRMGPLWVFGNTPGVIYLCLLYVGIVLFLFLTSRKRVTSVLLGIYCVIVAGSIGYLFVMSRVTKLTGAVLFLGMLVACYRGIVWISESSESPAGAKQDEEIGWVVKVSFCIGSCVLLGLVWLPRSTQNIPLPSTMGGSAVKLQRTGCFGRCPEYSLTLGGDGGGTYFGENNVAVNGLQTFSVRPQEVQSLLRDLDDVGFGGLEDRLFYGCTDTAKVAITVSVGKWAKTVVSDNTCVGPQSGPQAEFVKVANRIDERVRSDQWVKK